MRLRTQYIRLPVAANEEIRGMRVHASSWERAENLGRMCPAAQRGLSSGIRRSVQDTQNTCNPFRSVVLQATS